MKKNNKTKTITINSKLTTLRANLPSIVGILDANTITDVIAPGPAIKESAIGTTIILSFVAASLDCNICMPIVKIIKTPAR